ncbi:MAG TPA: sigma-70 family RNA polymerase sigma factor, partial [Polyangia bacterium]|nr:sigma-70 family RNA polymerase sigma factor [Polyangia bacterium]
MGESDARVSLDQVLANMAWLRRLARRLVADAAARDDVVQRVWLQAIVGQPAVGQALRPWLAGVLKNVVRMGYRSDGRRRQREQAVATDAAPLGVPQPHELVERVEVERAVAGSLLAVDEPYRTTLLLRYYEDLPAAEIARRLGIPAATVRWRLQRGLDMLRGELDGRFGDDRRGWSLALIPTAVAARDGATATTIALAIAGGIVMKGVAKAIAVALALVLLAWGGGRLIQRRVEGGDVGGARPGAAWRVAGGFGAIVSAPATVAGVSVPAWFGQPGAAMRRVAGHVTFAGAPVAGATVELGSELTDAGVLPAVVRRSGPDGAFDFGPQPPARYSVAASAPARTPAVRIVDTRDPTTASDRVALALGGCEAALFGHVADSSGGPIAGAKLCYSPPRASACVTSDDTGRYEVCVSAQQETIEVSAKGYGGVHEPTFFTSRRVRRDFVLTPEATIVGRVVRASDGSAIVGAGVRSIGAAVGSRVAAPVAITTDGRGRFALAGLAPGRHRLVARAADLATSEAVDITVEAGRTSPEVVLRLAPAARVSGVVVDDRGQPVAGAAVSLAGAVADAELATAADAVTQADGRFVLDAVPQGIARFAVARYDVVEPRSQRVGAAAVDNLRIVVSALGSIAGRVTRQGVPVGGVRVACGAEGAPVFSESDGGYVIAGLRRQTCRVVAVDQCAGASGIAPSTIALAAGEQRTHVDVELAWAAAISGIVVEEDGTPASGVQVRFNAQHKPDDGSALTGPDGKFRVGTLSGDDDYLGDVAESATSRHRLAISDGVAPVVHVPDGESEVDGIRIVVKRSHLSIAGTTVDGAGQPLGDVQVTAFRPAAGDERPDLNLSFGAPTTISTGDGSFRIDDVDAGAFVLVAHAGDGSEGRLAGIAAGQAGVQVRLQPAGGIDGTLVGFAAPPEVTARREQPYGPLVRAYAFVDGDTFRFRGLAPGRYVVDATSAGGDGGGQVALVDVVGGQDAVVTLRNRGTATVHGRVVDWRSGAGVAGLSCRSMLFGGQVFSRPQGQPVFTDGDGAFAIDGVTAG